MVTSWNWLYLSDFSSSFKPTFLPEDNPADFSFYFDTSGRRTCYLAPERFLVAGEEPGGRHVNWAMDIFSAGCVIAELFLESPIFTLSQMYKYRKGEYSPEHSQLSKIKDPDIRELILHMIQLEPESRYSADEYLNFWKNKAFPDYFYSFLHQYMSLITDPSSGRAHVDAESANRGESDDRIERIYFDFDKISYFLGSAPRITRDGSSVTSPRLASSSLPVQLDLPNYEHQTSRSHSPVDDGVLIFLTLVVSSLRNTAKSSARVKACDILLAFAERLSDEAKLDRILPYVMILLNDRADIVKTAAIRTLAQLLEMVQVVSPVNAYLFSEYVFPRLQPFIPSSTSNPSPTVRAAYASCIASLAQSSLRFLDMFQALRSDTRLTSLIPSGSEPRWTEDATYHNLYDVARVDLLDYFEVHTKALLTDSDSSVRRAFLGSVPSLCVFFGSLKTNEVILSHLNTYLNDRDWILKCAFFEAVVGVATYVGSISLEQYLLPLMIQSMTEPEEFVVERVIRSLASMATFGLFQRSTIWDLLQITVRFLIHPNIWIRESAAQFIANSAKYLSVADKYSILIPMIRPFLKVDILDFSEAEILDASKRPLTRSVYEMALTWASKTEKGKFWKSTSRDGMFNQSSTTAHTFKSGQRNSSFSLQSQPKNEEDEQWLSRLRSLGMGPEDEFKFLALKEYIWRVSMRHTKDSDLGTASHLTNVIPLTQCGVTPQTVFFDRIQNVKPRRSSLGKADVPKTGEQRHHTIADALLDASTTIEGGSSTRPPKNTPALDRQHRERAAAFSDHRRDLLEGNNKGEFSDAPSPVDSPPNAPTRSESVSPPNDSKLEHRASSSRQSPVPSDSTSPKADGQNPMVQNVAVGIQKRPSAINLLNRKENPKAFAETSTSSANVLGKLDVPAQRETPKSSASSPARGRLTPEVGVVPQYHASHSYGGNDPVVLRLLDSVFAENYPTDLFDLGPYVKEVDTRRPIKRASGHDPNRIWRPEGNLVVMFGEHSGPVNRVVVAPDHSFFVTASDDGTVKVWDSTRLERNLTPRSRQTHRHGVAGAKVKSLTFVENTYTFVSAATDGSVHAVKVDYHSTNDSIRYGKLQLVRDYQLPAVADDGSAEYAVWMEHFRLDAQSILLIATNTCRIVALNMKTMLPVYSLQNPVHHGTPTTFCCDRKHNWLVLGTTHGILDLWDLRFRVRLRAWGVPGMGTIHRLQIHPTKGRGRWVCVGGSGSHGNEITVWDIEKVQCREVYRAASPSMQRADQAAPNGAAHQGSNNVNARHYTAWRVDGDRPEGMLSRFATAGPTSVGLEAGRTGTGEVASSSMSSATTGTGTGGGERMGTCALAVGIDAPEEGKDMTKGGFILSAGCDQTIRFWDVARPEQSAVVSGLEMELADSSGTTGRAQYEHWQATPNLSITMEHLPLATTGGSGGGSGGSKNGKKGSGGRVPRSTVISVQQQQLLKSHLDSIQDLAVLRVPYGMTVSVDRAGMVYVFQ